MEVDLSAPVVVEESISIQASPERIWNLMLDFEGWPDWNPEIRAVRLEGPIGEGTRFSWKAGPGTIRSQVREINSGVGLAWVGKTMGITATHIWKIQETAEGTTVATRESWDGLHVRLFRRFFRRILENSIHVGLGNLKREAEKMAGQGNGMAIHAADDRRRPTGAADAAATDAGGRQAGTDHGCGRKNL